LWRATEVCHATKAAAPWCAKPILSGAFLYALPSDLAFDLPLPQNQGMRSTIAVPACWPIFGDANCCANA